MRTWSRVTKQTRGWVSSQCVITWWRHDKENISVLLSLYEENPPVPGESPAQQAPNYSLLMLSLLLIWIFYQSGKLSVGTICMCIPAPVHTFHRKCPISIHEKNNFCSVYKQVPPIDIYWIIHHSYTQRHQRCNIKFVIIPWNFLMQLLERSASFPLELHLPPNIWYKLHLSRQLSCWSLRCSKSIACLRCSNYIFILDLTPRFNRVRKYNCKARRETFTFCDLFCDGMAFQWVPVNIGKKPYLDHELVFTKIYIWRHLGSTQWSRVTHICVSNLIITGSDNGLWPCQRQAIIWTNAGTLLIGPLHTIFSEILIIQ